MDEDIEDIEPSEKAVLKRRRGSGSGKVDEEGRVTKSKRKGRVTIEVKFITFITFMLSALKLAKEIRVEFMIN